ncbi:hypothetical protein BASA60_004496 [Batrachochytrium salamandrivorans]|nr:hypothetical protein BASA60_004496 [Batrachochytrium salamandrivorans]
MERLADALRQDITSEFWRLNLERLYDDAVQDWEKEYGKMMAKKEELRQAKEERNGMVVKIHILKENQELQTGRDAHSRGQMGAYSGSNHPRKILEGQIDEACRNADDLFIANEAINEGINMLDDVIGREKGTKKGKPAPSGAFTHRIREDGEVFSGEEGRDTSSDTTPLASVARSVRMRSTDSDRSVRATPKKARDASPPPQDDLWVVVKNLSQQFVVQQAEMDAMRNAFAL